ncbi:uncharacterized protein LOC122036513 isoform X1 [Zingiber officinale]|uniref:uncharacterized protein LOC122036513 isoform X1 n=1 Tax=Zingiber officinale TaxID=94328 RepID=UPI001C4A96C9|nr:uncharacterized protein LOC122036513 isoform X1 [Zingiber officinale]XP_042451797.1 uncharacterized protein LOC122036513 isoform X1 [Zingiber officinale]
MDPHLILEIPDTPERLVQLVESSPGSSPMETNFSPSPQHQDTEHFLLENSCHSRDVGSRDVSRTSKIDQTKHIYRKEKLGQVYSGIFDKRALLGSSSEVGQTRVERTDLKYDTLATRNDDIFKVAERKMQKKSLGENNELLRSPGRDGLLVSQSSVGQPESETDIILTRKGKRILQDSSMKFQDKGKGVSSSCDSHSESHCKLSSATHDGFYQKPRMQRHLVRNGRISPCNTARIRIASEVHSQNGTIYSNGRKFYPVTEISDCHKNHGDNWAVSHPVDDREEIGLIGMLNNVNTSHQTLTAPDSEDGHNGISHCELSSATHDGISQKPNVQHHLVRNRCISPCNIARTRIASEVHSQNGTIYSNGRKFSPATEVSGRHKNHGDTWAVSHPVDEREEIGLIGVLNNVSTPRQTLTASDSEVRHNDDDKGKTICDTMMTDRQSGNLPPYRSYRSAGQEVTNIESCAQGIEDLCWTQNETSKGHMPSSRNEDGIETTDQLNIVLENHETSALPRSNLRAERSFSRSNPENWRKRYTDGKRKHGSTPEVSYLGTSCQPLKSRTTGTHSSRQRGIILGPVIEVDELHSPGSSSSDSSSAKARQIESDELLAQQLQEQLYNESESLITFDSEVIDEAIAWQLQEEENSRRASLHSDQIQHNHRSRLLARLHSQQSQPSRNYIPRSANYRNGLSARRPRLMRDIEFDDLDMQTGLDAFEEMEVGINLGSHIFASNILHSHSYFAEGDYETLLALDDNNHQHTGATANQINQLPQSTVQTDNMEPCAICIDKPSIGEIIRHLPCLHKFHKDCIDQWLRRKMSCPVCKSSIT